MKFPGKWLDRAQKLGALSACERHFLLRAWVAAPWVEVALAALGLARTLAWIEAASPLVGGARVESVDVARGSQLVDIAYRGHLLLRGTCLPRSLLQYLLHLRDGRDVRLVIGVRSRDHAHAWVEAPSTSHPTHTAHFAPIFSTSSIARGRERGSR